jgi:threonine synthase
MPKQAGITAHGMKFEDALRRMLNTPLPPLLKPLKKSDKKTRRKK